MHRVLVASIALAACLVASVGLAASNKIVAPFNAIEPAGVNVNGEVTLNAMPSGETQIHSSLRGLVPGTQYVSFVYTAGTTCASGSPTTLIVQFTANPSGNANFTQKVAVDLSRIGSVSVQRSSDNALLACAAVQ
jgi:hypothetical protein